MQTLDSFVAAALQLKKDGFEKAYRHPFLLLKLNPLATATDDWSFQTRVLTARRIDGSPAMLKEDASVYRVFGLVKGANNPWPERVSIGRARNNDVVISDNSVSKLHGHYTWDASGAMYLTDTNSRNGILVNGKRLAASGRTEIKLGDSVVFGSMQTTLISATQLFGLIETLLQK
jgi:hypothetical protein